MKLVIDMIASLLFCSILTIILVCQSSAVVSVFVIGGVYSAKVLYNDTNWELGCTDWFIVSKTTTTAFGVILMEYIADEYISSAWVVHEKYTLYYSVFLRFKYYRGHQ